MNIMAAYQRLQGIVHRTPLSYHPRLSAKYECDIYIKREDLQPVRSYKIRGAFNKIISLSQKERGKGVVCASAGNHAQGVAYTCRHLSIRGKIFMPVNTPAQKINRVVTLGGNHVRLFLEGDSYDACANAAIHYSLKNKLPFIHPFDNEKIIEGQATVALEILEDLDAIDYLFMPVGGGGLAAGVGTWFKEKSRHTLLIGVEPAGAASMTAAFQAGKPVLLEKIDPFVDGAAVKQAGQLTYAICNKVLDELHTVPEGKVCASLLQLYNEDGIVCEPAGCLSIAALDDYADAIKGKKIVCILSGSNNDSNRMEDIKKLADEWEGLQHHLIIRFHHYPDGLKQFFTGILGTGNYVNRIEYMRRDHGRSTYALVGIRSVNRAAYEELRLSLQKGFIEFSEVRKEDFLFKYLV